MSKQTFKIIKILRIIESFAWQRKWRLVPQRKIEYLGSADQIHNRPRDIIIYIPLIITLIQNLRMRYTQISITITAVSRRIRFSVFGENSSYYLISYPTHTGELHVVGMLYR